MNFILISISLFEKLDKNIEIANNEWHGAPFGEIETEPRNLAVFVNKLNNLATQSWKNILAFAS